MSTSGVDLPALLRTWADGYPTLIGAVELLTAHAVWLDRPEFLEFVEVGRSPFTGQARASFDGADVLATLGSRAGSDSAVLAAACSLVGGGSVDLRSIALAVDPSAARLIADAFATAGGAT